MLGNFLETICWEIFLETICWEIFWKLYAGKFRWIPAVFEGSTGTFFITLVVSWYPLAHVLIVVVVVYLFNKYLHTFL